MAQSKGLFSYNLFVHATSGSAASCVALVAAFPFLTVLQRKQCKRNYHLWTRSINSCHPRFPCIFSGWPQVRQAPEYIPVDPLHTEEGRARVSLPRTHSRYAKQLYLEFRLLLRVSPAQIAQNQRSSKCCWRFTARRSRWLRQCFVYDSILGGQHSLEDARDHLWPAL